MFSFRIRKSKHLLSSSAKNFFQGFYGTCRHHPILPHLPSDNKARHSRIRSNFFGFTEQNIMELSEILGKHIFEEDALP